VTVERLRSANVHASEIDPSSTELGAFPLLVSGEELTTPDPVLVRSPYDGRAVAIAYHGGPEVVERALASVARGFQATRELPGWKRSEVLERVSKGLQEQREGFARTLSLEAGKPLQAARGEVDRAAFTFKVAAEEARRLHGEVLPLDWIPGAEGRTGQVHRVPLGPILGITPFNYPLNLVAHKVAPALAAANSMLLRPDSQTPLSALKLGWLILQAGWPPDGIAVVPTRVEHAAPMVEDERIRMLSFTGSPGVGWALKTRAGRKRVALELGGNAATIVHRDANVQRAAERAAWGGFQYSGQSCVSVQRVYVHEAVYDVFREAFVARVTDLATGDPLDEATDVGPVIDEGAAERILAWVDEAVRDGASLVCGGTREGTLVAPTVLENVREEMRVACNEVFGPVVALFRYSDVDAALDAVDAGEFGLQAGLFTNDLALVQRAFARLEVGGLIVNDVSTFRIDHMPYGGVKASGFGREGVRYAIEEMTERKLLMIGP
jgi:acyl-CoA reductase-like NAD-dependent aldehyde dehydrogenase